MKKAIYILLGIGALVVGLFLALPQQEAVEYDYEKLRSDAQFYGLEMKPLSDNVSQELVDIGRELYHHEAISCSHCHIADKSFFSKTKQALGPVTGTIDGIVFPHAGRIDVQNVMTPTSFNAALYKDNKQLHDGRAQAGMEHPNLAVGLANSLTQDMIDKKLLQKHQEGYFVQAIIALQGHNESNIELLKTLNKEFGERLNKEGVDPRKVSHEDLEGDFHLEESFALAMACYQGEMLTMEAPIQKFIRGEQDSIKHPKGLELYMKNCTSCHNLSSGAGDFVDVGTSDLFDNKFTKPVRVPQLYNLKDKPAYGLGGHWKSVQEAILAHTTNITLDEAKEIENHLLEDWHDEEAKTKFAP